MFPVGGVEVMLAGALVSGLIAALAAWWLSARIGRTAALAWAGLAWSLVVIGLVTLIPAQGAPGWVLAEDRLGYCSTDIGGPAPDGFWIFGGGQRLLNTLILVPSGALLVLALARWPRAAVLTVPVGLTLLVGYSVAIELTQLALARLDRACDVTDMIDHGLGAVLGVGLGVALAVALRPWRDRGPCTTT